MTKDKTEKAKIETQITTNILQDGSTYISKHN